MSDSSIKRTKSKWAGKLRAEWCRIDLKCVIIGAVIVLLCGFLSALAGGSTEAFQKLIKPKGTPPAFLFPIIWIILYLLIGGAAGAIAGVKERSLEAAKYRGLFYFVLQMIVNFVWSPLFFGSGAYLIALLAIFAMILLTLMTILYFKRIYTLPAIAMGIYFVWLLYACYLNFGIVLLN